MSNLDGLTSGQSARITFTQAGVTLGFAILQNFQMTKNTNVITSIDITGKARHPQIHTDWTGSATYFRGGPEIDNYFADQERDFYLGGDQVNCTITETIQELNGAVSQWQYTDVTLQLADSGTYSGEDIVMQTINLFADRKIRLS